MFQDNLQRKAEKTVIVLELLTRYLVRSFLSVRFTSFSRKRFVIQVNGRHGLRTKIAGAPSELPLLLRSTLTPSRRRCIAQDSRTLCKPGRQESNCTNPNRVECDTRLNLKWLVSRRVLGLVSSITSQVVAHLSRLRHQIMILAP